MRSSVVNEIPAEKMIGGELEIEPCRHISEFRALEALQAAIWTGSPEEVVPYHMIMAIEHSGGTVIGAWDGDKLVGMAVSLVALGPEGPYHYSHMLGVLPSHRQRQAGMRLKMAQRDLVLAQGMHLITWTFDPLQSVNAFLNFGKLGVVSRTYKPDYYGVMQDQINRGLPSDRLIVEWRLDSQNVESICKSGKSHLPELSGNEPVLAAIDEQGLPRTKAELAGSVTTCLIEIPASFQNLKAENADAALQWRLCTREAFTVAFSQGYVACGYLSPHARKSNSGCYVLIKESTLPFTYYSHAKPLSGD
jgi:predicted GNAT superfamily acetyltransferase